MVNVKYVISLMKPYALTIAIRRELYVEFFVVSVIVLLVSLAIVWKHFKKLSHTSQRRMTWDEYGLALANTVAKRAACTRRQVGAVILDPDHRVLSTGYNGVPAGELNCSEGGCPRGQLSYKQCPAFSDYTNSKCQHAERNAIKYTNNIPEGSTIYITCPPCDGCNRLIKGVGIEQVIYPEAT